MISAVSTTQSTVIAPSSDLAKSFTMFRIRPPPLSRAAPGLFLPGFLRSQYGEIMQAARAFHGDSILSEWVQNGRAAPPVREARP
jgi:hypothetical protein